MVWSHMDGTWKVYQDRINRKCQLWCAVCLAASGWHTTVNTLSENEMVNIKVYKTANALQLYLVGVRCMMVLK